MTETSRKQEKLVNKTNSLSEELNNVISDT
jgi:hypothetical protein